MNASDAVDADPEVAPEVAPDHTSSCGKRKRKRVLGAAESMPSVVETGVAQVSKPRKGKRRRVDKPRHTNSDVNGAGGDLSFPTMVLAAMVVSARSGSAIGRRQQSLRPGRNL